MMDKEEPGITEKTLRELGKIIPGLESLLNIAQSSPAFKEKLKKKDEEIENKLRAEGREEDRKSEKLCRKAPPAPQADMIDEGEYIRVIVELPGTEEEAIKIELDGSALLISAKGFTQRTALNFTPKPDYTHSYRNGILEVKVFK